MRLRMNSEIRLACAAWPGAEMWLRDSTRWYITLLFNATFKVTGNTQVEPHIRCGQPVLTDTEGHA